MGIFRFYILLFFECNDIITTSMDHDNGFIDGGDLANFVDDVVNKVKSIFD